jgi:hypothetical protein
MNNSSAWVRFRLLVVGEVNAAELDKGINDAVVAFIEGKEFLPPDVTVRHAVRSSFQS